MNKDPLCGGCALINEPGPVLGEFTGEKVDVVFVGEALGRREMIEKRPFIGGAGQILRQTMKYCNISSYGITNIWRCKPPNNIIPDGEPAEFCKRLVIEDLNHSQKVTVPLGNTALRYIVQKDLNSLSVHGRLFSMIFDSKPLVVMPIVHPAFFIHSFRDSGRDTRGFWRSWELAWEKLMHFLETGKSDFLPLRERIVTKIEDTQGILNCISELDGSEIVALDIETSGFDPWADRILTLGLSISPRMSYVIPWRLIGEIEKVYLQDFFDTNRFLFYNGSFDTLFLSNAGLRVSIHEDVMHEAFLLDERDAVHSLKSDCGFYLDAPDWEHDVKVYAPKKTDSYEVIPEDILSRYCGLDVSHTIHLHGVLRHKLDSGLRWVYENILIPGSNMLRDARNTGIEIDIYRVKELSDRFQPVLRELTDKLIQLSDNRFYNPNSPKDKLETMRKRGLRVVDARKETLESFVGDEFVDAQLAYNQAQKVYSTYIQGVAEKVSNDMRIHDDIRFGAETGRLKSSILLLMPRKAEESEHKWKKYAKEIFVADKDTLLVHIDRKQSETRAVCLLAQDTVLEQLLRSGRDIHGEIARIIYGDGYTKEQRVWAKMVVFGLTYNRGAESLSRQLKCSVREAQVFIDKFFEKMPRVRQWQLEIMREAVKAAELVSFFGRRRRFGLITSANRHEVENEAVNFPPSSLSSDLNILSCVKVTSTFGKYGVKVLAPIHDAGLLRVPKDMLSAIDDIKDCFESCAGEYLHTDLPWPCDVTMGERWSDL